MPITETPGNRFTTHYAEGERYDIQYALSGGRVKIVNVYKDDTRIPLRNFSEARFRAIVRECESDRAARELDMMHLLNAQLPDKPSVLSRVPLRWQ